MQHIHRNQEFFFDKNGMHYSASPLFGLKLANDFFLHQFFEYMPSEPHGEGDIAVELWKKLEPGEK